MTGTSPDDCKFLCIKLEEARVDFVDLSGGTFEGRAFEQKKESTVCTPKCESRFPITYEKYRKHAKHTSSNSQK